MKSTMSSLRACSHEPGTVNYPGVMIASGPGERYLLVGVPGDVPFSWVYFLPENSKAGYTFCSKILK